MLRVPLAPLASVKCCGAHCLRMQSFATSRASHKPVQQSWWIKRQLKDPYVRQAHSEGMVSRAAYKLTEINAKHKVFQQNKAMVVVDLGSAPGGWSQVVASLIKRSPSSKSRIISVDILEMTPIAGCEFLQMDFTTEDAPKAIIDRLSGTKVDVVLSDMAPSYSGNNQIDHDRLMTLANKAFEFAKKVLKPGGSCIIKISIGGTEKSFTTNMGRFFQQVHMIKPSSSRKESSEMFVLAKGFVLPDNN